MSRPTQCEIVLQYIKDHGKITTYDSFQLGITRLSARIWELRHKHGIPISKARVNYKTKTGIYKHYDVYMLGGQT